MTEDADDITFPSCSDNWGTITAWVIPGVAYWVDERYWKVEKLTAADIERLHSNDWDELIYTGEPPGSKGDITMFADSDNWESTHIWSQKDLAAMLKRLRAAVAEVGWEWPGG